MRHKQNLTVSDMDWDDTFPSHYQYGAAPTTTTLPPVITSRKHHHHQKPQYNTIFSDNEDNPIPPRWTTHFSASAASLTPSTTATYVDPLLSSGTYHIHQAENALSTLKHVVLEDGWKKALKHKSGVVVHMMNGLHKADKTPIFKGEAIIHGFSPQSIFYVIGMRKLWDEQYEDGNLVENLNDTTSLTYEVTKPTATSKPRDFALVERIECTQNGSIIFAATSVETPRLPRIQGRTRAQIKLQGWILEPVRGSTPSTKVTFVVQENMKGWVPGFAKKSLARRPLVIALINDYLQKKSGRARTHSKPTLAPLTYGHSRRPSLLGQRLDPSAATSLRNSPSPTPSQHSILLGSNTSTFNGKKRITFAEQDITYPAQDNGTPDTQSEAASDSNSFPAIPTPRASPQQHLYQHRLSHPSTNRAHSHYSPALTTSSSLPTPLSSATTAAVAGSTTLQPSEALSNSSPTQKQHQRLYPIHRHSSKKAEILTMIKQLSMSPEGWVFSKEQDGIRYYSNGNYLRSDGMIYGGWTPEQLCSVIHCIGARKIWDDQFEHGDVLERFSQKDYLVRWAMKNGGNYTVTSTIETDTTLGTIYTASASVDDVHVTPGTLKMKLYGWVFVPVKDDKGRRCVKTSVIWDSAGHFSSKLLPSLDHFLATNGCPPYIRRVAGKVLHEELLMMDDDTVDPTLNGAKSGGDVIAAARKKKPIYTMKYVVKHEPSNSYRARKSNPEKNWCTDIRIHSASMYSLGFDVSVSPSSGTRVDVSEQHIKIFTTTPEMEGKQVSITIAMAHTGKVTCNGALMFILKDIPEQHGLAYANITPENTTSKSESLPLQGHLSTESEIKGSDTSSNLPPQPAPNDHCHSKSESLTPLTINHSTATTEFVQDHNNDHQPPPSPSGLSHTSINSMQIPKGYVLIPQHQHQSNNIVIISDDLTFNGQQLAVMFVAMLLCYYMGKFACVCQ
ncbi:unnamed protein product [Absidia cylindrospora]